MWWKTTATATQVDLPDELKSMTIIITGANRGIGFEMAKIIAKGKPGRLILTCRDLAKGEEAVKQIVSETGCTTIQLWQLDLESFSSVRAFVQKLNDSEHPQCHLLIHNAAVSNGTYKRTADGYEHVLQVNHLSSSLLVILLLPNLAQAKDPRIILVGSYGYKEVTKFTEAKIEGVKMMDALSDPERCTGLLFKAGIRYPYTKLLQIYFGHSFHSHISPSSHIPIITTCPGLCDTDIMLVNRRNIPLLYSIYWPINKIVNNFHSAEEGARRVLVAAFLEKERMEKEGWDGSFVEGGDKKVFKDGKLEGWANGKDGAEVRDKSWMETIEIVKKVAPEAEGIVNRFFSQETAKGESK